MSKQSDVLPPNVALGTWLGRRQAFAMIASQCAAAEAETIRHIRQARLYKSVTPHWSEFCLRHLSMSKSNADRLIRLFDEFGAAYFHAQQFTGISPAQYRTVAPPVGDCATLSGAESLVLAVEKAQRFIANLPSPLDDPQGIPTAAHRLDDPQLSQPRPIRPTTRNQSQPPPRPMTHN